MQFKYFEIITLFLIFARRALNNLAAESRKVPLLINLVSAPDRKDRRCLTVSNDT